jgi:hypothetical protein
MTLSMSQETMSQEAISEANSQEDPPSRWSLIDELLPDTIVHARSCSPFYQSLYADAPAAIARHNIHLLPTVDKPALLAAGNARLATDVQTSHLGNTSGSTGRFFLIHRSAEEYRFINQFFSTFAQQYERDRDVVVFSLSLPSHGTALPIPMNCFSVLHCIIDDRTCNNFMAYLSEQQEMPGGANPTRIVVGALTQVLLFTKYCTSKNIDLRSFRIASMTVFGDYLSKRVRQTLGALWGCSVIDRYSLSEIFGGASQYGHAGGFDFDPFVYPELIEPDSANTGELLLTSLYPFVQRQPMIRYRTGDIFTRVGDKFLYRGRRAHCLWDEVSKQFVMYGADLYDVLDDYPLVARQKHALGVTADDHAATGKPIVKGAIVAQGGGRMSVEIRVGVRADPRYFSGEIDHMRDDIEQRVRQTVVGDCSVTVHADYVPEHSSQSQYDKAGSIWC